MDNAADDLEIVEPEEERQYSYREKALRDFFVSEYLVDYDSVAAAIRVGYSKAYAKDFAAKFMNEPYVMREIRRLEGGSVNGEGDEGAERRRIIAGLKREANYRGPGSSQSARVAALSRLATLHGMDPVGKPKEPDAPIGEGTFVVPGVMTPEQWAEAAAKQQADLVSGNPAAIPTPSLH